MFINSVLSSMFMFMMSSNGEFLSQSLYRKIMETFGDKDLFRKAKLPLKIHIFPRHLKRGVILTKDNLYIKKG